MSPPHVLSVWWTYGPLVAEICWRVWGIPTSNINFNVKENKQREGFHVLALLVHGTQVVGISQSLRCWTEGTTYIQQGGHQLGIGRHSSCEWVLSVLPVCAAADSLLMHYSEIRGHSKLG